ncbi:MAG: M48 family metallopeptidase [Candidatus Wallbacteria bacterium]|nr:M48 family metallopeptidase [Candidatus Wallbacteria bacterium]
MKSILKDLDPVEFEHPVDRMLLVSLRKTGLDFITRKVTELGAFKLICSKYRGSNFRISPGHGLYKHLEAACGILGIEKIPELYLKQGGEISHLSAGTMDDSIIVLNSGCLENLAEDELLFSLGHELGHIVSRHILLQQIYNELIKNLRLLDLPTLGLASLTSDTVKLLLRKWIAVAEYTADRAGLLVCQNEESAVSYLMKLSGTPLHLSEGDDPQNFRNQASEFKKQSGGMISMSLRFMGDDASGNNWAVLRCGELLNWINTGQYSLVLERKSSRDRNEYLKKREDLKSDLNAFPVQITDCLISMPLLELPQTIAGLVQEHRNLTVRKEENLKSNTRIIEEMNAILSIRNRNSQEEKKLEKSRAEISKNAAGLGAAVIEAVKAGKISDSEEFSDLLSADERFSKAKQSELAHDPKASGFLEKTKVLAQGTFLKGNLKLAESQKESACRKFENMIADMGLIKKIAEVVDFQDLENIAGMIDIYQADQRNLAASKKEADDRNSAISCGIIKTIHSAKDVEKYEKLLHGEIIAVEEHQEKIRKRMVKEVAVIIDSYSDELFADWLREKIEGYRIHA